MTTAGRAQLKLDHGVFNIGRLNLMNYDVFLHQCQILATELELPLALLQGRLGFDIHVIQPRICKQHRIMLILRLLKQ